MRKAIIAIVLLLGLLATFISFPSPPMAEPCSAQWAESFERDYVQTSDRDGHGPDIGSSEWYHAVQVRLDVEPLSSADPKANCLAIAQQINQHRCIRIRPFGWLIRLF